MFKGTQNSSLACSQCCDFYLIPTGCLEDRRPTVICAQGHVVCAKCALIIKTKKNKCPKCYEQILETTRIDLKCMSTIEKCFNQKSIQAEDLQLNHKAFERGNFGD